MKSNIDNITSEILKLSDKDRLEVAKFILFLDHRNSNSDNIETEWEDEILERINAIDNGTATGIEYSEVLSNINTRFSL